MIGTTAPGGAARHDDRPVDVSHAPLDRQLAYHLMRLDRRRYAVEHHATLAAAELRLLWLFSDRRPRTLREIADALGLEQSTVNRQVNGAIRAGHLHRYAEEGRSARLVAPTEAGLDRFEADTATVLRLYERGLAALGERDAKALVGLLDRFVEVYGEAVAAAIPDAVVPQGPTPG